MAFATGPGIPGLNRPMVIVVDCGDGVQRYAEDFSALAFPHPPACPRCAASGHLVGHGSYPRTVTDPTRAFAVRVKRLFCTVCRHTFALLPTFCVPFRHDQTATVQAVLSVRLAARDSWATVQKRFSPADLPTRTTCQGWVGAFVRASDRYRAHLLRSLATWPARSAPVEVAITDLAAVSGPPTQVIAAVPHLASWVGDASVQVAGGGQCWLATLWQWESSIKLGRLVGRPQPFGPPRTSAQTSQEESHAADQLLVVASRGGATRPDRPLPLRLDRPAPASPVGTWGDHGSPARRRRPGPPDPLQCLGHHPHSFAQEVAVPVHLDLAQQLLKCNS